MKFIVCGIIKKYFGSSSLAPGSQITAPETLGIFRHQMLTASSDDASAFLAVRVF